MRFRGLSAGFGPGSHELNLDVIRQLVLAMRPKPKELGTDAKIGNHRGCHNRGADRRGGRGFCGRLATGDRCDRSSGAAILRPCAGQARPRTRRDRQLQRLPYGAAAANTFAGGLPVPTPFGTIYSSNITPDPDTGIGRWSEAAFRRAMRSGVDRDGHHLYPTFPYDHFTNVNDEDDRALYAFLMTRPPVRAPARANDLRFPLDQRFVVAGWKLLFLHRGTYKADSAQSAEWNRGAYLVEGLAHCGACHTPRNALGAEKASASFAGGDVDNWHAYAINAQSPSPVPWNTDALFIYLRYGWHPDHGVARGPMAEVVSNLSSVPENDVRAIATLYGERVRSADAGSQRRRRSGSGRCKVAAVQSRPRGRGNPAGAAIYAAACASLPRDRPAAALWRRQSRSQHGDQRARSAQCRQRRSVGHSPRGGRTQSDHAGFCQQHDRRSDCRFVELFARPLQHPTGMDRR